MMWFVRILPVIISQLVVLLLADEASSLAFPAAVTISSWAQQKQHLGGASWLSSSSLYRRRTTLLRSTAHSTVDDGISTITSSLSSTDLLDNEHDVHAVIG